MTFRMLIEESFDIGREVVVAGVIQHGNVELNEIVEAQTFGKNPSVYRFRSRVKKIERHLPLGIALFLETDWRYNWWLKDKDEVPKHSIIISLNADDIELTNDGSSSDNPIIVKCPKCSISTLDATTASSFQCHSCWDWFDYTYQAGKWYQGKTDNNAIRIIQYIGGGKWKWETGNKNNSGL